MYANYAPKGLSAFHLLVSACVCSQYAAYEKRTVCALAACVQRVVSLHKPIIHRFLYAVGICAAQIPMAYKILKNQ